jgi:hypothetical protein
MMQLALFGVEQVAGHPSEQLRLEASQTRSRSDHQSEQLTLMRDFVSTMGHERIGKIGFRRATSSSS